MKPDPPMRELDYLSPGGMPYKLLAHLTPPGWGLILISIVVAFLQLYDHSWPTEYAGRISDYDYSVLAVAAYWAYRAAFCVYACARLKSDPAVAAANVHRWRWITPLLITILSFVMVRLDWPMHLRFYASLPAMNHAASRITASSGPTPDLKFIGLYGVECIQIIPGGMRFGLSGAPCGFAYLPRPLSTWETERYMHVSGDWYWYLLII